MGSGATCPEGKSHGQGGDHKDQRHRDPELDRPAHRPFGIFDPTPFRHPFMPGHWAKSLRRRLPFVTLPIDRRIACPIYCRFPRPWPRPWRLRYCSRFCLRLRQPCLPGGARPHLSARTPSHLPLLLLSRAPRRLQLLFRLRALSEGRLRDPGAPEGVSGVELPAEHALLDTSLRVLARSPSGWLLR